MKKILFVSWWICVTTLIYLWYSSSPDVTSSVVFTGFGEVATLSATECLSIFHMFPDDIKDLFEFHKLLRSSDHQVLLANHSFSLVAAYDFPSYIVVTIESVEWYRNISYCRYLNNDWDEIYQPVETVVFPKHAVHCCKKSKATFISVTGRPSDEIVEAVPIQNKEISQLEYTLSLCIPPIFGNESKWLMLVEMVEHYKLQDVDHFYFYVKNIDKYSEKLMMSYVESDDAEAVFFKSNTKDTLQLCGVQDCLQRTRYRSRYVIFADLDERIIPVGNVSLSAFIQEKMLYKPYIGMLRFTSRWVPRTKRVPEIYEGDITLRQHLPTLIFHNTSPVPPLGSSAKCVLDPTKVFYVWVHRVKYFFPGYKAKDVNPLVVYIRHYRDMAAGNWGEQVRPRLDAFGPWEMTNYPKRLMNTLYAQIKRRLDKVYGNHD